MSDLARKNDTMGDLVRKGDTMSDLVRKGDTMSDLVRKSDTMSDLVRKSDTMSDLVRKSDTMSDLVRKSDTVYVSKDPEATYRLGYMLGASVLSDGDVLILTGDLGAGKTQLTKGIAQGLGSDRAVVSPTFTLMISHTSGRVPLFHFDFYRLEHADDLGDTGVFDVLGEEGISVIEWGERFADDLTTERLDIVIRRCAGETKHDGASKDARDDGASKDARDDGASKDARDEPFRELMLTPHGERARQIVSDLSRVFEKDGDGH